MTNQILIQQKNIKLAELNLIIMRAIKTVFAKFKIYREALDPVQHLMLKGKSPIFALGKIFPIWG